MVTSVRDWIGLFGVLFKSRLAQLIAQMEGFGKRGTIPTRLHNPGDLRHGPGASHSPGNPDGIGTYTSDEAGARDLQRQLTLYAERGYDLRKLIEVYAPPVENNTSQYLKFICDGLSLCPESPLTIALQKPPIPSEET